MRLQVPSLALLSGLRIQHCRELWCRLQTWLRSRVAVGLVQASGYSSDWTPGRGTSICRRSGPRKGKKKNQKKEPPQKKTEKIRASFNDDAKATGYHLWGKNGF